MSQKKGEREIAESKGGLSLRGSSSQGQAWNSTLSAQALAPRASRKYR